MLRKQGYSSETQQGVKMLESFLKTTERNFFPPETSDSKLLFNSRLEIFKHSSTNFVRMKSAFNSNFERLIMRDVLVDDKLLAGYGGN